MSTLFYKTLRERVAEEIRNKILKQELTPGMRIIEQNLSEEFGISRGPIREALRQLEQEGLVEYVRNVGCSVREISIKDEYETYLLRSAYEVAAVQSYHGSFEEEELQRMKKILDKMKALKKGELGDLLDYDYEFHCVIVEKSGLSRLISSWKALNYASNVVGINRGFHCEDIFERQFTIHTKIYEACLSNSETVICEAIRNHYMDSIEKMMSEQNTQK